MKKQFWLTAAGVLTCLVALYAFLLFFPKNNGETYRVRVEKGQGFSSVSRQLAKDNIIFNRWVLMSAAYLTGTHHQLMVGHFRLPKKVSAWEILSILNQDPDKVRVKIIEGMTFAKMRKIINQTNDIEHDTRELSDQDLLKKIDPNFSYDHPEGWFFPDSYEVHKGSSDLQIFQAAYAAMQDNLKDAWDDRQNNLPYATPYELLIVASLIEKETAHEEDRRDVSAVFRNRLDIDMRLQTDPSVIYGMGDNYRGKIRKADLQRDTPYNTYTRKGLTPTPIALPSRAALEAAANPSDSKYLYFVSRMDGTGKSQFSTTLDEHNAAVCKYILKQENCEQS